MNRRKFLAYSSAGLLTTSLGSRESAISTPISPGQRLTEDSNGGLIGWDEFIERSVETANHLIDDRSQGGQDAYLHAMGSIAARLGELPELTTRDFGDLKPSYELSLIFRDPGSPFIILYWKMEPGAVFPAHCHPGANVCTLCTDGRTMIRNFDTGEGSPRCWEETDDEFDVIETRRDVLLPGAINIVSELRNNIHRFEAGPEGASGIDITHGYDSPAKPFSYLELGDRGTGSAGESTFRGRWVGKDIKRAV